MSDAKPFANTLVHGDCIAMMQSMPSNAVHFTFTSPPYYNAREYAQYPSYPAYLDFLERVFHEVHRITHDGRFLVVNTSPVIEPRESRQDSSVRYGIPFDLHTRLTKDGLWEFFDDIVWVKPEGSAKGRVAGFVTHRKPLMYRPNCVCEYLMVYRKSSDRLVDWNIHQYSPEQTQNSLVMPPFFTSNVWYLNPASDDVHDAVFPLELCQHVIPKYTWKGDVVFDPFMGTGTVARSAVQNQRYFLGAEMHRDYVDRFLKLLQTVQSNTLDRFAGKASITPRRSRVVTLSQWQQEMEANNR